MKTRMRVLVVSLASIAILVIIAIFAGGQIAKARTINVDDGGGKDYTKIQDAIDNASVGDTIYVYNGTYAEQLTISKSINLVGESNQSAIIKGTDASDSKGVYVTANYVNISDLRIDNFYYNVYLSSSNTNITSNTITNSSFGIYLDDSNNNQITFNIIMNCTNGICRTGSNNIIASNKIADCLLNGIFITTGSNNNISSNVLVNTNIVVLEENNVSNNTINDKPVLYYKNINTIASPEVLDGLDANCVILYNCSGFDIKNMKIEYGGIMLISSSYIDIVSSQVCMGQGIHILYSSNNNMISNTIGDCIYGFYVYKGSNNNKISSNIISNCSDDGITIFGSSNIVCNNAIVNCSVGTYLYSWAMSNNITSNTITNCDYGIYIDGSSNTIVSNNIHNNKLFGMYLRAGVDNTAAYNWWGSPTGPHNNNSNSNGTGDNITDDVPFSPWATSQFNITVGTSETPSAALNQKPTATITSIAPNPAIYKQSVVTFVGSGNDSDGTIIEYLWESNVSGIIGTNAAFTNNSLPAGVHKITFKVKDNNNTWSEPVSITLTINTSGGNVSITEKSEEQKKGFIPFLDFNMIVICIFILAVIVGFRRRK